MARVDISSKSGSVVSGNWTPAIAAAWADIKAEGGTIYFDEQEIRLDGASNLIPDGGIYVPVLLQGDRSSRIKIAATASVPLAGGNLVAMNIRDLVFLPNDTTNTTVDCVALFGGNSVFSLDVESVTVAGIRASNAVIAGGNDSALSIRNSQLGGCAGPAIVKIDGSKRLLMENVECLDYQNLKNVYHSKTPVGVDQWVYAVNPPVSSGASHAEIALRQCRFDEGAGYAFNGIGYPHIELDQCSVNVGGGGAGFRLEGCGHVIIKQCNAGYTANNRPLVKLINCGNVTVIGQTRDAGPFRIETDSASNAGLKLLQSPDVEIDVV